MSAIPAGSAVTGRLGAAGRRGLVRRRGLVGRLWAAGGLAAVVVCLAAGPALAGNGLAMAVDVHNANVVQRSSDGTTCTWQITSDVTVVNLTSQTQTFTDVTTTASWTGPGSTSGVVSDVTIVDNGGLQSGDSLAPHAQQTFSPYVTQAAIPCNATGGDLAVAITTPQGTGSGDAPFIQQGTPVPLSALGALGLSAVLAVMFGLRQRRRRLAGGVDPDSERVIAHSRG